MWTKVLLILGLVCFILAAFEVSIRHFSIGWLGLAFWIVTLLIGGK